MDKIFLIGFMGCGKSTFGRKLAHKIGWEFIDLDDYIEKEEQRDIKTIFELEGENYFRELETNTLNSLRNHKSTVISCGGGTPCFNENIHVINELGLSVYIKLSPETLMKRLISEKSKRPLIASKKNSELLEFIEQKLNERQSFYHQAHVTFDYSSKDEGKFIDFITEKVG